MKYRNRRLKGLASRNILFMWHKQIMFLAVTVLAGYYHIPYITIPLYLLVLGTEFIELYISRRVLRWEAGLEKDHRDLFAAKKFIRAFTVTAALNASLASLFLILLAHQGGTATHFTPLILLLIMALFATIAYHQLTGILVIRLVIYGAALLYIPLYDLWLARPPLSSIIWLEFATVLCCIYFIYFCARSMLWLYIRNLDQFFELAHQRRRAENLYNLQSQFVSIISHELRTPLTSIKGSLSLIDSGHVGKVPSKIQKLITIANRNSIRLVNLINDLLDVQKFDSGKMVLDISPINITKLVKEAVEANVNYESSMNVTFKTSGLEHAIFVNADYNRLMQVMANVLSNAIKFSKEGGVVEISLEDNASKVCISIQDHGEGIPDDAKEKVFAQFEQIDSTHQRKVGGTGLGMYITKKIMDGHIGNIDFTSEMGKGTTFYIELQTTDQDE